jgi:hypothetical protein
MFEYKPLKYEIIFMKSGGRVELFRKEIANQELFLGM